ncbi:MAG: hypothetical protein IJA32_11420, partial [Lachnospiraceae bacterium]|nr:hypothetical protein [Lachnospiraceae bacterium]
LKFSEMMIVPDIVMLVMVMITFVGMYVLSTCSFVMVKKDEIDTYFSKQRKRVLMFVGMVAVLFFFLNYSTGLNIIFYSEIITVVSTLAKAACKRGT